MLAPVSRPARRARGIIRVRYTSILFRTRLLDLQTDDSDSLQVENDDSDSLQVANDDSDSLQVANDHSDCLQVANDDSDSLQVANDDSDSLTQNDDSDSLTTTRACVCIHGSPRILDSPLHIERKGLGLGHASRSPATAGMATAGSLSLSP